MNLRLSIYELTEHAKTYMKRHGITYELAVPQSMGDQWWFFGCKGVPDPLPEHLTVITQDPMELIGHGLSREEAECFSKP